MAEGQPTQPERRRVHGVYALDLGGRLRHLATTWDEDVADELRNAAADPGNLDKVCIYPRNVLVAGTDAYYDVDHDPVHIDFIADTVQEAARNAVLLSGLLLPVRVGELAMIGEQPDLAGSTSTDQA